MSDNDEYYDDRTDDRQFEEDSNAGAPSQLLSPTQAATTRYSASLSASSLIESLDNDQDDDSVASIDVNRVGFTPRTSVAMTESEAASDEHPYGYASDPYARADDSMDERDVEAMLLSERSMQYDDEDQQHYSGQHRYEQGREYDEFSDSIDGDEDFGYLPGQQPHDWPHEILTVEDVRTRRTKPLSTIAERSSVGSRSQASQSASQFSPRAGSEDIPPVPRIPSIFRQQTGEDMLRQLATAQAQDPSPPTSLRSHHSRASTDPGAAPPFQPRSASPVKSISTSSSSLGIRDRIAFFEERVASPTPGLVQGARPGSPSGIHGLGLGLGLSPPGLGLTFARSPASMLSTPFSPAQSMPPMSPSAPSGISYHSSMSSLSQSRPASPVKSVKSYQSSEAPSANIPSYASSPHVQHSAPVAPHQAVSSRPTDNFTPSVQEPLTQQPRTGHVQRIVTSLGPMEESGPGLFDVRRRQSLRRASAGATEHGSGHGHERSSSEQQRAGGSGSGGARSAPSHKSTPSQGSRPRSDGGSGDGSIAADRSDMPVGTNNEEPLRVGNLWYLHVHTGDERFRWIKCKAVLFRSQLQLTWVEAGGGKAIIGLDLLNCHEVRSVPSPNHASAWEDIGNVAARAQALDEAGTGVEELCPFQMLYEDGVERLGAGSPRERMKWVGAIWDALNRASVVPSRTSSPAQSIGTIPSQHSSGTGSGSGSRHGSASTVFIPAEEDVPDMGSTISSLSRSSFRSVPMDSPYQSESFYSARRPRSIDDTSLPSHGHDFMSPSDARITIAPSRTDSLRRTSSMTDLDEYASAASPRTETETFQSESEFDMPRLPSRGPSSIGSTSLGPPRTIASGSSASSASSPGRPLPELPALSSIPSMPSLRSGTSERYDTATGYTSTATGRYDTATDITSTGSARQTTRTTPTARRQTVSTTTDTARRFDTPLGTARSTSTFVPPAVASLRPPSAPPSTKAPSENGSTTSSFLTAPSTRMKTPAPKEAGSTSYSPTDDGPVRRIRPGKASSVYSLSSVNEQERHRQAADDSSTVDEYGSMLSSPAPSISSVGTPKLLGTTTLPRLAFRGPDSGSMLGDSHVGGSPGTPTSSSSRTSGTSKSYATPRTPSRLSKIVEQPTGSSVTSLVRSLPGTRPRSSRFPATKSATTSGTYLTAEDKENAQDSSGSGSESYLTASEKTPTKSTYSGRSVSSEPISPTREIASVTSEPLSLTREAATAELTRSETEDDASDVDSMGRNESEGEEEDIFDPQGATRLSRADSYYTTTSAGLARAGSIAGDSTYSTIAYDICVGTDVSSSGPQSVRSQTPTPVPSTPYQNAPQLPASPMSMSSIPTIRTESQYNTADQMDNSTEYSTAMHWTSSSDYDTVPPGSSPAQSYILPALPSSRSSSARVSNPSLSPAIASSPARPASTRVSTPLVSPAMPPSPSPARPVSARMSTSSVSAAMSPSPVQPASARMSTSSVSAAMLPSPAQPGSTRMSTPLASPAMQPSPSPVRPPSTRMSTPSVSAAMSPSPAQPGSTRMSTPLASPAMQPSPSPVRPPSTQMLDPSASPAMLASPVQSVSSRVSTPSASTPGMRSVRGTPTPSVVGTIPDAMSEISVTSATLSSESSVTPTQSRTMSLASRSISGTPFSTPKRVSAPRSISSQSAVSQQAKSTTVSSVSSLSTSTASSASSITASPLPTPMSASSKSLSSVTTSVRAPASFLMPPVPPPSSTRGTRSKPVSEVSYASSPQQSMGSSLFEYTPSAVSTALPGDDYSIDSSILRPSIGSSDAGEYDIILMESSEGGSTPSSSGKSTSIPMAQTPSIMSSLLSASSLTRSESVSSMSSLRSSIFLPSRSSSIRSVAPTASISDMHTPRSPTVSVTMTPAQSFHPSFRDDLSTVPSEDEEVLAAAPAPMEIISHDVNRLVQYLDGVDRQRVAEHSDVKDQLDRVEEGLRNLTDFIRQETIKPRAPSPAETVQELPEPTDDVVMHSAPRPAVILLDLPAPESPLKLSSGSVTDSIAWLSSPSSVSVGLQEPPSPFQPSEQISSLTDSSSLGPFDSASQVSAPMAISASVHYSVPLSNGGSQKSDPMAMSASGHYSVPLSDAGSRQSDPMIMSASGRYSVPLSDTGSRQSNPMVISASVHPSVLGSDSASPQSAPMRLSASAHSSLHPSDLGSQVSGSVGLSESAQYSVRPSDSASQQSGSVKLSDSAPNSPVSEASTIRDEMSVSSVLDSGVASSVSLPSMPGQSLASTPPPSVPGASPPRTPLSSPARTRGGTPDIEIVSASGRGSPARSDITVRQPVSNSQLRDMLHDLRDQTNKLMAQQNRANDAIEELQNRPPIQLPPLPATPKTPRRSPYADLLSQIADTLKNIVEAGEAARDLPVESEPAESVADTEDSGSTIMNNLQNRLHDVLGMPAPPRQAYPVSTAGAPSVRAPDEDEESLPASSRPVSLYDQHSQHIDDFPRIHRPIPNRRRLMRSTSPRILERPGTAPLPSGPAWGRPMTIYQTPARVPATIPVEAEAESRSATPRPVSDGPDLDLLRLVQDKRKQRRGGDGTFIPGGDEIVEEYVEPPPRPDTAPIEFSVPDEQVARSWYNKRPKVPKTAYTMGDPRREESEPPSPPKSPAVTAQRRTPRPTIPLGELPSTASYAEMLALLRQNELMQRHQNEQQNELVRYLHDLNGWLARDVSNRQAELQGVEGRIAHLQNALAAGRTPAPYPVYIPEQEPVMPVMRMPSTRTHTRFGEPEGDDYMPRMGHVSYGPPPTAFYHAPPPMDYPSRYQPVFGEPESPAIVPARPRSRMPTTAGSQMPIIEVRGAERYGPPSRPQGSSSPQQYVRQEAATAPPATIMVPASQPTAHMPPPSSQPPANIINVNVPPTTARSHSRSPSRHHRGRSHYTRSPTRHPHDSRSPIRHYLRDGSHSPRIIHTGSRPARSSRRAETVVIHGQGSPERDYSDSHSRSRSPIIVAAPSAHTSRHRPRSQRVALMQEPQESRRSRSRSPRTIMVPAPVESRRSRSRSPRTVMIPAPMESRRSRSRSPRTVMIPAPVESRRSRRSRSPRTVMIPAPVESRRSRSRSPRTVMIPAPLESRRSRSRSPRTVMVAPTQHRRSRSRSPRTIMVEAPRESRRSRSPRTVVMEAPRESRRSRSPRTIVIPAPSTRRRSRSPTRIVMGGDRSRSRSHSRERRRLVRSSRRSRSRSPIIIQQPETRRRSRSPERVIIAGPSERPHSTRPIILEGDGRNSRRGFMSRLFGGGGRSRSPTRIFAGSRRRSRSPRIIETGGRRSRSRSRSPRRRVLAKSRSRTPPIIINADRPRSRSPRHRHSESRRERSRTPPVIITGSRRDRSRSPRRSPRRSSHREHSRISPIRMTGSRRDRSRSPRRLESRRSRSPVRIYEGSRRDHRSRSRSRSPRRRHSYSPRQRRSYSPRERGSRSPRHRRSYSPRRRHEGSHYDPVELDAGTRRHRGYSPRRSRSPLTRRLSRSPERDRGSRRGSRSPTRRSASSPPRRRPSLFGRTASLFGRGSRADPVDYDRGRHRQSPREGSRRGPEEHDRGSHRGGSRGESRGESRYDPEDFDPGTHRGSRKTDSRYGRDEYDGDRRKLHGQPGHSLRGPDDFNTGPPRSERPDSRRLTRLTISPPGTRLTRRSPSPDEVESPVETRAPRTHHSGRPTSPITVLVRDGDYEPISRPATRGPGVLSTIHEGDSIRTSPSIIQVPGSRGHRSHATLRVASPGFTTRPTSPTIIRLPGDEISRRTTPQMLRVGTPRSEAPSNIIRLPSAPPQTPSRAQVLRVGTPRAVESAPTPEPRVRTPPQTFIQLPGQPHVPVRSQTIRVGGTPIPPATPVAPVVQPAPALAPAPSIIQLPGQARDPQRSQTIRVGTPAQRDFVTPAPMHTQPAGVAPSIIQLPGGGTTYAGQTVRVASPSPSFFPESVIRVPGQEDRRTPFRSQTIRVGSPPLQPASPSIIRIHGQDVPARVPTSQLVRVAGGVEPQPPVIPTSERSFIAPMEQIIRIPTAVPQPPVTPSYVRVGGQPVVMQEQRREPTPSYHPLPTTIQLPSTALQPSVTPAFVRVGGQPIVAAEPRREPSPTYHPAPTAIQLPGTAFQKPMASSYVRVGGQPIVEPHREATPIYHPAPTTIQLPGAAAQPPMSPSYVRVGGQPEMRREPTPPHHRAPTTIQLPGTATQPPMSPSYVRVGGQPETRREPTPPYHRAPTTIQLPGTGPQPPMSPSIVRVGGQPVAELRREPTPSYHLPTTIQLPGTAPQPPTSPSYVRVGGQPDLRREQTPSYHPLPTMIQLPGTAPQPPATPSYVRVGGQPTVVDSHPPPTTIQLPTTHHPGQAKSPMVRVTAPSTGTPAPASIAAPASHLIRLPGTPSALSSPPAFVRVPEGVPGGFTTVPGTVGTPGVVRVERQDRAPTVIQVASPGPGSRYVRATPSPGSTLPGFVRPHRIAATPGLSGVPEIVRVGDHTPVPGGSRTSTDRPISEGYPEHRPISITSVGGGNIIAPVASRSSMAGLSIAGNLEEMAREEEEEAELRRIRRGAGGIPANAFAVFEDRESKRQRQFEEFLEAQRLENERLRETLMQMAPGHRHTIIAGAEDQGHISQLVAEAVDTIKSHRDSDRASIMSVRDEELRRDLDNERARVRELELELAQMREQLEEERSRKTVTVEDKCAEMHDAVRANHDEVRVHLADLTNVMQDCKDDNARRAAEDEDRRVEKEARRQAKAEQQAQLQMLLAKMAADQDEDRRIAEEERRLAAERASLDDVIAQLRHQNAEQQQLLVTLLDEYRSQNAQQSSETIEAVRAAVAQHVPMDIKAHLNDFSKSLAEEVRLLLREVGKLREEKRNIQYEIGCMLCLKSKYGPGGEFDPEWRPATGPLADGPPMPSAPGEENPVPPPDDRPMTAPPAWRTIHTKRRPAKKRETQPAQPPPPPPMPSAPAPAPMPVYHHVPTAPPASTMPPPSVMDQSRQQSWYAWQPDPRYAPSSPSSAPMYEVPESRPLGFFGPRSPRDTSM